MARIPTKSLDSGFTMPTYGMGTWQMGGRRQRDETNDDAADIRALKTAIDLGVTHFDTAEIYAAGRSEELLGEAIKGADRKSLFLVSKVDGPNQRPEQLRRSFEASCERIGTDYLDMYMLHIWNSDIPVDETMDALCQLIDEGLVRHPAVSNFNVERMQRAQKASRHKIVANQVHYNLQVREVERAGLLQHCQSNDVFVLAWGPVQKGALDFDAPVLRKIASKYEKTPAQVAINWLVSQKNVITLSKTRSPAHLEENIGGLDWTMDAADVELLRQSMPDQQDKSDRVTLDYA